MNRYPKFTEAVAERDDLEVLAETSGVPVDAIRAILDGLVAALALRDRLAAALDADPVELFRLRPDHDQALPVGAARYITDPAVLRVIDRRAS